MSGARGTVVLAMSDVHAEEFGEARPETIGTLPALRELRHRILDAGFDFTTLQQLRDSAAAPVYALWDFGSFALLPRRLRTLPCRQVIAWSLESPLVAHRAYHRIDKIAARAARVLTFTGARNLLSDDTGFRPVLYPNEPRPLADTPPWEERDLLTLIATNKTVRPGLRSIEAAHPYRSVRRIAAGLLARSYRLRGKWEAPDLYTQRLAAIEHFSRREDFALFGAGWTTRQHRHRIEWAIHRSYRGPVRDKHEALAGFRFALCFENTRFPGYITEKLFDCLYARTIPIYRGAPDIADYVPPATFIDAERFTSPAEIERYIVQMPLDVARHYLGTAEEFLRSSAFARFSSTGFVDQMMAALDDAASAS